MILNNLGIHLAIGAAQFGTTDFASISELFLRSVRRRRQRLAFEHAQSPARLIRTIAHAQMEGLASDPLVWRVAGLLAFNIVDASSWEWYHYAEWVALLWLALDILARLVLGVGSAVGAGDPKVAIKDGGKRLLAFEAIDKTYITINKLMTGLFTYHAIRYCWNSELISWGWPAAAVVNTPTSPAGSSGLVATVADATAKLLAAGLPGVFVLAVVQLALLYFVYDFGYTLFHWALHHPSVYSYVHKHHHRQVRTSATSLLPGGHNSPCLDAMTVIITTVINQMSFTLRITMCHYCCSACCAIRACRWCLSAETWMRSMCTPSNSSSVGDDDGGDRRRCFGF